MPRKSKALDPNSVLANIMLQERADKIKEEQSKEASRQIRLKQQEEQENNRLANLFVRQKRCDHLLGNHRQGVTPDFKRTALRRDEFSDKTIRIYCEKCRGETHAGDTAQHWYQITGQGRVAVPNPWGKNYREMRDLFYSFSNAKDRTTRAFRIERVEPEEDLMDAPVPA